MKPYLIYFAGIATPFVVLIACTLIGEFSDWRDRTRYERAWKKFGAEWDAMDESARRVWKAANEQQPWDRQYASDRDYFFARRWKYGHCTDV